MFKIILLVGFGGFAGSVCRYLLTRYVDLYWISSFPFGTFAVNVIGCFVIGLVYGLTIKELSSPGIRLLLATGFCGGFTTFSSFSYEFLALLQDGQLWYGFLYSAGSILTGLAAVWLAIALTRSF